MVQIETCAYMQTAYKSEFYAQNETHLKDALNIEESISPDNPGYFLSSFITNRGYNYKHKQVLFF